jgi:lipopolysaccharide heptosyltransferase II
MKILVRLPNWLGDMVMSIPFLEHLQKEYPQAGISVIVKKELEPLLQYFPPVSDKFIFSKTLYPGIGGVYRFGKQISRRNRFDFYFSLPDSFSAALVGWASGAAQRIGYANEGRSVLLTKAFKKNTAQHRVIQYLDLLQQFRDKQLSAGCLKLYNIPVAPKIKSVLINIHSEAISRRLPKMKAVSIISHLQKKISVPVILIGGPADAAYTKEIIDALPASENIINKAGTTSLAELPLLMNSASVMLSTDSGPAHIAGAVGLPIVILFGAGNEHSTAPFNEQGRTIIRLGQLPCEPCVKNTCRFGLPKCLEQLDENKISDAILNYLK